MDKSAASLELFNFIYRFCSNTALSIKLLFTITGSYRNCTLFINFFYMLFFSFLIFSSSLSTKLFYNYLTMLIFEDCKLYTCHYCLLHVWLWQFELINFSLYFFGLWFMHYECTVFWNTKKYTHKVSIQKIIHVCRTIFWVFEWLCKNILLLSELFKYTK